MEEKSVLVTGIGGNVGQGILRNIIATQFPIRRIGCNVVQISAGNHLCDTTYVVPYAMDQTYIQCINDIVKREKIDLILPSTDYEVYYLSKFKDQIDAKVVVSDIGTSEICLDKYKTFMHHASNDLPFAESFLPSDYEDGYFDETIVKPREGRGSRGININPSHIKSFDDSYMVQKLTKGKEITTAFYVDKSRNLHGFINLQRSLENGATNECFVNSSWNEQLEGILHEMIKKYNFRGSANLQSIVTDENEIVPFEINCRISGTNSVRANFGFEDVKYALQEYLYDQRPAIPQIIEGSAIRIMMDVIYPNQKSLSELKDNSSEFYIY